MLIAIYGPSRAGKDSVAGFLVKNYGFEQRNFATPIRDTLLKIYDNLRPDISQDVRDHGWDYVKAKYVESVESMITLGQSMRDLNPRIWLDAAFIDSYTDLVIPDVRQPNEAKEILQRGGEIWKIERPSVQQHRGMDGILDSYVTFDAHIINDRSLTDLENIVDQIMQSRVF